MGDMNSYKISIIVPVYNAGQYLEKCVKSIINQTYDNLEIILVNDGSTDNSLEICKRFTESDKRISLINKENGGVSSARNRGIDKASGDYIGFVDSDDYISVDMYEKLLDSILKNEADISECGYYMVDSSYNLTDELRLKDTVITGSYNCSYNYLIGNNATNFNWNKLYKASIFENVRFPKLKYSEDFVVNVKAHYYCNKKVTINDCCYYYYNNETSAVNQEFNNSKLDIIHAGQAALKFINKKYPDLNNYLYLFILNNIRTLYEQLQESKGNKKREYARTLSRQYKRYYSYLKIEIVDVAISKKTLFALKLFYFSPKLYYFINKMYRKFN